MTTMTRVRGGVLTPEQEKHLMTLASSSERVRTEPPCRMLIRPTRIDLLSSTGPDSRDSGDAQDSPDWLAALDAGVVAFNVRTAIRGFGHGSSIELGPDPLKPRLFATARIRTAQSADPGYLEDLALFRVLESDFTPVSMRGRWWSLAHLVGTVRRNGGRFHLLGQADRARLGLPSDSRHRVALLVADDPENLRWTRLGFILQHLRLLARLHGLEVVVPEPDLQVEAQRTALEAPGGDPGSSRLVFTILHSHPRESTSATGLRGVAGTLGP